MGKVADSGRETSLADGAIDSEELVLTQVRESLRNLQFGHVQIIVQDGVVVQIDRLERRRISKSERQTGG
jgi:hypothetical protein